jgi:hypothetical protein
MSCSATLPPDASARLAMLAEMQRRTDPVEAESARAGSTRDCPAAEFPRGNSG